MTPALGRRGQKNPLCWLASKSTQINKLCVCETPSQKLRYRNCKRHVIFSGLNLCAHTNTDKWTKDEVQLANPHVQKNVQPALGIKAMQMATILRESHPGLNSTQQRKHNTERWQGWWPKDDGSHRALEGVWTSPHTTEISTEVLNTKQTNEHKPKNRYTVSPSPPLLGICPGTLSQPITGDTCTSMFIEALFATAKLNKNHLVNSTELKKQTKKQKTKIQASLGF